jgi:hypothetical protein
MEANFHVFEVPQRGTASRSGVSTKPTPVLPTRSVTPHRHSLLRQDSNAAVSCSASSRILSLGFVEFVEFAPFSTERTVNSAR